MSSMKAKKPHTESDRLSDLPDDVLCHIISFIPIKDTVRTTILSTRWKNLYTLVPTLNLYDNCPRKNFMNNVDRVLFARKRIDVDRFLLRCGQIDPSRIEGWIHYALWHNVREVDLDLQCSLFMMPAGLFTCKTLVSLKLKLTSALRISFKVSFPNLKIICLQAVLFWDDDSFKRLFSSCFVLEELVLDRCFYNNMTRFNISNSSLKRLIISHHSYVCLNEDLNEVLINAPSLVYFKYDCFKAKHHLLIDLYSLVEAYIHFRPIHNSVFYAPGATDLIRGLRHVQSLDLSGPLSRALLPGYGPIPIFENMTSLKIGKFNSEGWEIVLNFAPCLENLVFKEPSSFEKYFKNPPMEVPPCLISQMKAIKFLLFEGRKSEMRLVEYFLKHAQVLESLIIHLVTRKCRQVKITEKLLKFPRVSEKCQVVIL